MHRHVVAQLLKILRARDEVGLAIHFHQHADLPAGVNVATRQALPTSRAAPSSRPPPGLFCEECRWPSRCCLALPPRRRGNPRIPRRCARAVPSRAVRVCSVFRLLPCLRSVPFLYRFGPAGPKFARPYSILYCSGLNAIERTAITSAGPNRRRSPAEQSAFFRGRRPPAFALHEVAFLLLVHFVGAGVDVIDFRFRSPLRRQLSGRQSATARMSAARSAPRRKSSK